MLHRAAVGILVVLIAVVSGLAAGMGIFSGGGPGPFEFESIRGRSVTIYGYGLYRHMSAEVAPQGIAQDYVTLFLGIPLLLVAYLWARGGSLRGRYLLAGVLGYFFVTYLFYLMMGMYNPLFLAYAALLAAGFFALALTLFSFNLSQLPSRFRESAPIRCAGGYLMFTAVAIALLWLSIVVPPLLAGAAIPPEVEHYTTLVVQGLDLGLLLPLSFVSGYLFLRKRVMGYLLGPVYMIFLALLMTALSAKVVAMGLLGYNIIPAVFIIPTFNVLAIVLSTLLVKNIDPTAPAPSLKQPKAG